MFQIFLIFFSLISSSLFSDEEEAFIIVPVADLVGHPLSSATQSSIVEKEYHNLPFSGLNCSRIHQALFNERVYIVEDRGLEVKVRIPNFYYLQEESTIPQNTFWTLKKNLMAFNAHKKLDIKKIPSPISFEKSFDERKNEAVVTLKMPFHDPKTHQTYSMGTRFIACPVQEEKASLKVFIYDPKIHSFKISRIPHSHLIEVKAKNSLGKVKNFVKLLKSWCYLEKGFIPYVLGGSSWTSQCEADYLTQLSSPAYKSAATYHRSDWVSPTKHGLDCMGIIGRAAQMCEIPFFIKNTTTLPKKLRPLRPEEPLIEGDLFYWQWGHVMVFSDIKAGLLIESRGYDQGYGRVQEIHISKVFQDIQNFDDLKKAFFHKKPLKLLHKEGTVFKTLREYKILKLQSLWEDKGS